MELEVFVREQLVELVELEVLDKTFQVQLLQDYQLQQQLTQL